MAEGCPPRRIGLPTVDVARVTGTRDPACWVTHAVAPSGVSAIPSAAPGRAIGVPTTNPVVETGTTLDPPHTYAVAPEGGTAMPVGLIGRAMARPARSLDGLMGDRGRVPKSPTSTSPAA